MKKTSTHLLGNKRDELKHIASVIRSQCDDVEMVIFFGVLCQG